MNAPGEGAAVSGSAPLPWQRRQNSSGVSSRRSSNSSAPNRMVSGTTITSCCLTRSSVRSQALSVTIRTPGMGGVCHDEAASRRLGRGGGPPDGGTPWPAAGAAVPGSAARRPSTNDHGAVDRQPGHDGARPPDRRGAGRAWRPRDWTPPGPRPPWPAMATPTRRRGVQVPSRAEGTEPAAELGHAQERAHGVGDGERQGQAADAERMHRAPRRARC